MEPDIPLNMCGLPTVRNRGAISWSPNGLIAVGSGTDLLIIEEETLAPVQVIHSEHKSSINRVLWNPYARQLHDGKIPKYHADLLSTDTLNNILLWDVEKSQLLLTFNHPESKQLLDVKWITTGPDNWKRNKVYLLYANNILVIYDLISHQVFQNFQILDSQALDLTCFDINPYSSSTCALFAFLGEGVLSFAVLDPFKTDRVQVTSNISLHKHGSSLTSGNSGSPLGHPVIIPHLETSSSSSSITSPTGAPLLSSLGKRQSSSSSSIRKLVSDIIVGPENPMNQVIVRYGTIEYLHSLKDHLIVWTPREIYLVNTHFQVISHYFQLEKSGANFASILVPKTRPCLYTLHENGTVQLRKYSIAHTHHTNVSVSLDTVCSSDNPRFGSKKSEVLGGALVPSSYENKLMVYLSDGRFCQLILNAATIETDPLLQIGHSSKRLLPTPVSPYTIDSTYASSSATTASGYPNLLVANLGATDTAQTVSTAPVVPKVTWTNHSQSNKLTSATRGILEPSDTNTDSLVKMKIKRTTAAVGQITCLKTLAEGVLIVGTVTGHVIVIQCRDVRGAPEKDSNNICKGTGPRILKKILVHSNSAVSGMEIISETELLVWTNLSFSANPKCELSLVEINIGGIKVLKQEEPSHIGAVKVSPSKLYFVIAYKNGSAPCELWDLPRRQLIKTLPSKLPPITCVAWKTTPEEGSRDETFYMTDLGTFLFTFRVDGNRFSNATCVKLDGGNVGGIPVALFSRGNLIYRGDSSGSLVIYNTEKKTASPGINLGRGPLFKILDLEDFFVVQFSDQLELWDTNAVQRLRIVHSGKLKATEITLALPDVLGVILKNSGALKFLRLHTARSSCGDWYPTVKSDVALLSEYPQFWTNQQKLRKILEFVYDLNKEGDKCEEYLQLITALNFEPDEIKFWKVFAHSFVSESTKEGEENVDPDLFCQSKVYKDILVKTAQCAWQLDAKKREVVARTLILAGESEKSAEILLDTDPSDSINYIANGLKASVCVGSANIPESTKAVLKIVATNLIASGKIDDGLELLCMLRKHSEACNYIESTNDWDKALLLCKTSLGDVRGNSVHANETLSRYAQYLNTCKYVLKAASLFVSIHKYDRAVEILFSARKKLLAFLVLQICENSNVSVPVSSHIRLAIKLDFARFVFDMGLQTEAIHFCEKLGDEGKDVKSELLILSS